MITEERMNEIRDMIEYGSLKEIADRLNEKNLKPKRAKAYTSDIIANFIRGVTKDVNIEIMLLEWSNEKRAVLARLKKLNE